MIGDSEFRTKNFTESAWKQSAPVKVTGSVVGRVEVGYLEERPEESEGPFLKEERLLIDAIAKRLGRIAERKRAEEELKESEEGLRIASQIASDVVYERDLQTGIATFYGDIDSHLGYGPGEYPRTMEGWREHVHPEDLAWIDRQSIDQIEPGVPHSVEYRMRKKDGTYMTWWDRIILIRDEETGKPIKFIGVATDITERKRAEEELRQSEEKFAKAFHSSPDPISITTLKEGRYLDVNDSFLHATGYRPDEVIGRTTLELGLWARSEESGRVIRMVQTKGRVSNLELDFRMKSGQIRTGLVSSCNSKRYDVYCLHGRESKSNYLDGGRAPATGIVDSQRNHGAAPCATGPHRTGSSGGKDDQGDCP